MTASPTPTRTPEGLRSCATIGRQVGRMATRCHDGQGAVSELVAQTYRLSVTGDPKTLALHTMGNTQQAAMSLQAPLTLTLRRAANLLTLETALHNAGQHAQQVNHLASDVVPRTVHRKKVGTLSELWANAFQRQRSPMGRVVFASA